MTKEEAAVLFEQVIEAVQTGIYPLTVSLVYTYIPEIEQPWAVVIGEWNGIMRWHLAQPSDWPLCQQQIGIPAKREKRKR